MELKLYIRQKKLFDKTNGQERHISGKLPSLKYTAGSLPTGRRFPKYGSYIEITDFVTDLYKLKLTWTLDRDANGLTVPGTTNQKKAASGSINFEGDAYQYIKKWLIDDDSASLNELEVKITDTSTGTFEGWTIKATDIRWCEGDVCVLDASLKQIDDPITCIKRTLITDDHQGWFGSDNTPWSGKKHPRFSYCNEIRPNAMLVTLWWTMTQLMSVLGPTIFLIASIVNPTIQLVVNVMKTINWGLKILKKLPGGGKVKTLDDQIKKLEGKKITVDDVKDIFGNFFVETAGCGREHPAPLIRDYISNVCSKCGITVNDKTAPIFFAQSMPIETSVDRTEGKGVQWRENPHYNACYFNAVVDKGIRRFRSLNIFKGAVKNTNDFWLPGNAPLLFLDQFLDELKTIYNAEWRVIDNELHFKRKDHWLYEDNLFDFSINGKDRDRLLEGICYEWDETKSPVYGQGIYTEDAADVAGNAAMKQMNGYAQFDDVSVNPVVDGVLDKTTDFGATKFRLDGASADYVYDAMQQVVNTTFITGSIWTRPLFKTISGFFNDYADYGLLIKQDTVTLPKILIWDTNSILNAKCVKTYDASTGRSAPIPPINEHYNVHKWPWYHMHKPETDVLGRKLAGGIVPKNLYDVRGLLGKLVVQQPPILVNYPMYFEPGFKDTLWDWFHYIDDPRLSGKRHMKYTAKVDLCRDILDEIEPYGDAYNIQLGQKIKLPGSEPNEGRINEIEISWDTSEDIGPYVQLKGTL